MPEPSGESFGRVHAFVSGWVQGVGFRWFVSKQAHALNINGWVRNLRDGRVELEAEGRSDNLRDFLLRVRQGPSGARVYDLESTWLPYKDEFRGFDVRY